MASSSLPAKPAPGKRLTRRPTPTLEQARAFVAVAESATYREAADSLGFGKDHVPVIRLVARFTRAVGVGKLVNANRRGGVTLTDLGMRVFPAAQTLVQAADALSHIHDDIRFSSYPAIAGRLLAAAPDLLEGEEHLSFYGVTENNRADGGVALVERTLTGELDIVIASSQLREHLDAGELKERELYRWQLQVVLPGGHRHALAGEPTISPARLARFKIVCAPAGHKSRALLERTFTADSVPLTVATESANQDVLYHMAANSKTFAAVLPSDSFIQPPGKATDRRLGPELVAGDYHPEGRYSVYARKPLDRRAPTEREQSIERLVQSVIRAFRPEADMVADLTGQARNRRQHSRSR